MNFMSRGMVVFSLDFFFYFLIMVYLRVVVYSTTTAAAGAMMRVKGASKGIVDWISLVWGGGMLFPLSRTLLTF